MPVPSAALPSGFVLTAAFSKLTSDPAVNFRDVYGITWCGRESCGGLFFSGALALLLARSAPCDALRGAISLRRVSPSLLRPLTLRFFSLVSQHPQG